MQSEQLRDEIVRVLEDMKAEDIRVIDVREITDFTDYMIIASGTSDRHVAAMANRVADELRSKKQRPIGVEGQEHGEWVLLDFGDAVVHVMRPETRKFYDLEGLWSEEVARLIKRQREQSSD